MMLPTYSVGVITVALTVGSPTAEIFLSNGNCELQPQCVELPRLLHLVVLHMDHRGRDCELPNCSYLLAPCWPPGL